MTTLPLPALAGHRAHGWLAALGLLRILARQWPHIQLSWDRHWAHAELHDGPTTIDEAVAAVRRHSLDLVPAGGSLPGVDPAFPPAKARGPALAAQPWAGPEGPMWQTALTTPAGSLHPLVRPHAAQTLQTICRKIVDTLRDKPELLHESIAGPGLGLTPRYGAGMWLLRSEGDAEAPAASPGRDWLALMSAPWSPLYELTTVGEDTATLAVGWQLRGRRPTLAWSLWTEPVHARDIPALLASQVGEPAQFAEARRTGTQLEPYATPLLAPVARGPGATRPPDDVAVSIPWALSERIEQLAASLPEGDPRTPLDVLAALLEGALAQNEVDRLDAPMQRLLTFRRRREALNDDIREAHAGGHRQVEIARTCGYSRQQVAKILDGHPLQ